MTNCVDVLTTEGLVRITAVAAKKGRYKWMYCFVWSDGGEGILVDGESVAYSSARRALRRATRLFTLAS